MKPSRAVFKCFKWLERQGDRITGAAGPYFVGGAVILICMGVVCFFDVILPSLRFLPVTAPACTLIALNLLMHYYYVCTVPPGFVDDPPRGTGNPWLWAKKRLPAESRALTGVRWSNDVTITRASTTRCRKCTQIKPERSHHCRICDKCVLKYDHHCPGINQCVGLHNERHFVLFRAYLVLSTFCFGVLGYDQIFEALGFNYQQPWNHHVPEVVFLMEYILSVVLCLAVGIMLLWHLWSIALGETSVEAQDHDVYRRVAKERGDEFVNSYDLGKWKNLELFFNVGNNGYPLYTLVLPLRINPYTDGRAWARREGYERHRGVRAGEELTDDEDEEY
ncbi:hypothetical protein PLICRDRAFT_45462 [Plicaturopsis crispa FD-325 SS-3]|uniref:Palmitoyltransferase n=1 Tax=Plicaturopsis crispa FD-325 SS-3 TaxID=944288 RepID=A0A0C9TAF3_PLICR|nr:hypothetical protein PLICRDRAFT_45462 [Plicaturopsis crispa FD-325 SS-3]